MKFKTSKYSDNCRTLKMDGGNFILTVDHCLKHKRQKERVYIAISSDTPLNAVDLSVACLTKKQALKLAMAIIDELHPSYLYDASALDPLGDPHRLHLLRREGAGDLALEREHGYSICTNSQ